jgi:hypothetical protein
MGSSMIQSFAKSTSGVSHDLGRAANNPENVWNWINLIVSLTPIILFVVGFPM